MNAEEPVRECVSRLHDAWNAHDGHAFAALFLDDANFTNVFGMEVSGRQNIELLHVHILGTMFRESRVEHDVRRVRFVRPDVAAAAVCWRMTGARDPQGNPWPEREGLMSLVLTLQDGGWKIAVMNNMDLPERDKRQALSDALSSGLSLPQGSIHAL